MSDRPTRWACQSCDWAGDWTGILAAPSPFDPDDTIRGCPKCKAVEDFVELCDVPGCEREASCGWPSPDGYRRTCHVHWK